MASLIVLLIIAGCAALIFLKGTIVRALAAIISAVCANIIALSYFEFLSNFLITRNKFVGWAQTLVFLLLFLFSFVVLMAISTQLTRKKVNLGVLAERIGRIVCGIFLGLIISGILLTAFAMAPLPNKYPYQRFDETRPDPDNPKRVLLNADGLTTGWFSIISSGSLSGKRSFAILHADFLNQIYLNRHNATSADSIISDSDAIRVQKQKAVWLAPENIKDSSGKSIPPKSGHKLMIVEVRFTRKAIQTSNNFTLSQLRLICKPQGDENIFAGKGITIYPIGYLKTAQRLQIKNLTDKIQLKSDDFQGQTLTFNFGFHVPTDYVPALIEFKQNAIAVLPTPIGAEQAPETAPFVQTSGCESKLARLEQIRTAKIYGIELCAQERLLAGLTLDIKSANEWDQAQTPESEEKAIFMNGKITCVMAKLKIEEQTKSQNEGDISGQEFTKTADLFKPRNGYVLVSLKCNNPSGSTAIRGDELPVLIELSGAVHHSAGVIATGKTGEQTIHEVDYCSLTTSDLPQGLTIKSDGSVAKPFPESVWLTERTESITEFYVLYLIKRGGNTVISGVKPADSQTAAGFRDTECFLVK